MKNQNKRYNVNDITRETFYQLPKVFFSKHSKYEKMSLPAAVAFSFLKDRFKYSIKNNWIDENGDIYFIFTNQELGETLKVKSKQTVVKIKKELESYGLLEQKRMGVNRPNRLYLLQPEVTATDVYEIQHAEAEEAPQTLASSGSPFFGHNQYKDILEDTKKIHTDTQLDFSNNRYSSQQLAEQNADLVKHANQIAQSKATESFLNSESINLIKSYCKAPEEIYRFEQIILNAKNAVKKEMINNGFDQQTSLLTLENISYEMTGWLRNYFNRIRQSDSSPQKQIKDYEGYLYTTMVHNINHFVHECLQNKEY